MKSLLLTTALWALAFPVGAFDVSTHAAMTSYAIAQSNLTAAPNNSALSSRLGLFDPGFLGRKEYMDIGPITRKRDADLVTILLADFRTKSQLPIPQPYSLPGWIVQGVVREDDNTVETPDSDEPDGIFNRVFGHFYDPQNNRGLTVGITMGDRAVDWALVRTATVREFPNVASLRNNHFNIATAREAMWRALTLTKPDGAGGFSPDVWPS